uniref:MmcQ/YjbR family DNA-binding protein n=2 Tax=unclassified Prevotella TaxID=2638335 RepID=A0AB33IWQ6_9BACT
MNIEEARSLALQHKGVTEELFAERWISFRIEGKWFMLIELDTPEPRIAVKLKPEHGQELREQYDGVRPAYHMNKKHWNDIYLDLVPSQLVIDCIAESYQLVVQSLPKKTRMLLQES